MRLWQLSHKSHEQGTLPDRRDNSAQHPGARWAPHQAPRVPEYPHQARGLEGAASRPNTAIPLNLASESFARSPETCWTIVIHRPAASARCRSPLSTSMTIGRTRGWRLPGYRGVTGCARFMKAAANRNRLPDFLVRKKGHPF